MTAYEKMEILLYEDYDYCAAQVDLAGAIANLNACIDHMHRYGHTPSVQIHTVPKEKK